MRSVAAAVLIVSGALLGLASRGVPLQEGAPSMERFDEWLCECLTVETPETRLTDFPDPSGPDATVTRSPRGGAGREQWEFETHRYRVRLRYRQPAGRAVRTDFELRVEQTETNTPFLFPSRQVAESWLSRLAGDGGRVTSGDGSSLIFSDTRSGSVRPHFRVVVDWEERVFELFWQERWLVDHPHPAYRRFGPDYRDRLCDTEKREDEQPRSISTHELRAGPSHGATRLWGAASPPVPDGASAAPKYRKLPFDIPKEFPYHPSQGNCEAGPPDQPLFR